MTNGNTIRQLIAANAAVFLGFVAVGGTIPYTEDTTVTEALVMGEDTEISVAENVTVTYNAAISGDYKLTKSGKGMLVLKTANTFGSLDINAGIVTVGAVGALGSGAITIAGSASADCQLRFDTTLIRQTSSFSNKITLNSSSAEAYAAIYFVLPTATQNDIWSVTFTGDISAKGDLYIDDNHGGKSGSVSTGMDWQGETWVVFDCAIDAKGKNFQLGKFSIIDKKSSHNYCGPCGDVHFKGAVTAEVFYVNGFVGNKWGSAGDVYFYSSENAIGEFKFGFQKVYFKADNALGDTKMNMDQDYGGTYTILYLEGHSQAVKSLESVTTTPARDNTLCINGGSGSTATLTIDGSQADSQTAYITYKGNMAIEVNAQDDGFVQTQSSRTNTMTGAITVKRGTFKLINNEFNNVPTLDIQGGTLEIDSVVDSSFPAVTAISVANGGTLRTVQSLSALFKTGNLSLSLEEGATLDVPGETLTVKSLTFEGRTWAAGQYTRAMIPVLPEGMTLTVTSGTWGGETTTANWSGASEDNNLMNTSANWEGETVPPLNYGLLKATLKGGNGIDYADGIWINQIVNDIEPNTENPVAPFVIKPASEGAMLHLSKGINSDEKTQLVLSGHLTDLPENSVSSDNRVYYKPSSVVAGVSGAIQPTTVSDNAALPLVLKDVTLDMPLVVEPPVFNMVALMSYPNTTNEVRGLATISGTTYYMYAETDSVIRFLGGFSTSTSLCRFRGVGEFEIHDSLTAETGIDMYQGNSTLSLNTTNSCNILGNASREGIVMNRGTLNMLNSDVLNDELQVYFVSTATAIELNATTQTLGVIYSNVKSSITSYLHGDYPALLKVTGKLREGANKSKAKPTYWNAKITGGLSIHFTGEGTNEVFTLAGRNFESCGDLTVSGKKLELASDAKWLNGTNFTAKGTGTLKFSAANQVNSDFAVLHMEGDGKVEIPEGVTLSVYLAETNGVWLKAGKYTCETDGAAGATGIPQLTGGGVLEVRCDDEEYTRCAAGGEEATVTKPVVVSNSWVVANVPSGKTLNDAGANGFKYWKCYVLGLDPADEHSKPIIKGVQNANPNKLAFTLGNVTYNADSGVLAEYTIKESTAINGTYYEKATNTVGQVVEFDLPAEGVLHYYQGVIRYRDAQ